MKKYLKILSRCPLFVKIKEEDLYIMLGCLGAKVEKFDKKYTVMAEGNPARYIGVVLSGTVQIIRSDYYGNRSLISELDSGEVFGEAFACAEVATLPITVMANEPCEIMFIDRDHILNTCKNHCVFHEQLIYNLMKDLAEKTLFYHQKIEIISKRTTREKIMTYLMIYSQRVNKSSFEIPFDRQELADYLEVERSGLSAEIGKLKREGLIDNEKNHFTLL